MSLDNFYSLRENFIVLGLTGRTGGGCNDIVDLLTKEENPFINFDIPNVNINEKQKIKICRDFVTNDNNKWVPFKVIKYQNVILLYLISELANVTDNFNDIKEDKIIEVFSKIFDSDKIKTPRIGEEDKTRSIIKTDITPFLAAKKDILQNFQNIFKLNDRKVNIYDIDNKCGEDPLDTEQFNTLFFGDYFKFCQDFFLIIDKKEPLARQLFLQDAAINLRGNGGIFFNKVQDSKNIYTVAEIIKQIIKVNKKEDGQSRLIIDSLKNSLEINYFKERYSGFYLISSNSDPKIANEYLKNKIENLKSFTQEKIKDIINSLQDLDETHYKINAFKDGDFNSPDIENCIQKAEYYVFKPNDQDLNENRYYSFEFQLLKLIALILKPGIITPNAFERSMQLAFSSKYNSGCISRQVGAIVTDKFYSVKAVGWNEVPEGQTPCSLRSMTDLVEGNERNIFTKYERNEGDYDGKTFKEKVKETILEKFEDVEKFKEDLKGHSCPFCFKEYHNKFEAKDNQVHTRSLHAEENAMLQITKYGGQPLRGGNLFTTASPCELCSKKAYQLGIKNIYYIDPYPGIAKTQILKSGSKRPKLFMFQGAVGRGYFKFFEPYLSIKDETKLRFKITPKIPEKQTAVQIRKLLEKYIDKTDADLIQYLDRYKDDPQVVSELVDLLREGVKNKNVKQ
ncbi:hypothetical protein [Chryseobacterium sp. JV274]|uniref:hypothetical protein n=1 Tax=Chryseobacterium sp. JV274 TaxID=1932669 RepID=UPI000987B124|nr:hypothetical protein [Chryseobacterium sp. JV274]CAD0219903.1 CMP/dCMP-type deaminase domain-containing protein [Chryseobacterium sp. JV274]